MNGQITKVVETYRDETPYYIQHSSDGTYGVNYITAPDAVFAVGSPARNALGDSPEAPIFVCEIEDHNRTLPVLIRHVGGLFANYPNLNAVVGIKGGTTRAVAGDRRWAALFMVEQTPAGLSLTDLLDFGPWFDCRSKDEC